MKILGVSQRASTKLLIIGENKMKDNATISSKVNNDQEQQGRENHTQNNLLKKFSVWWNTKVFPAIDKAFRNLFKMVCGIRINWTGILVLVILINMAQNGIMEDMPGIKWIVESAVRLIEWCFGILKSFISWFTNFLDSRFVNQMDILGILKWMANLLRDIFAV